MTRLHEAFIAANRFGLGARSGELGAIANDPRGWLKIQLDHPQPLPQQLRGLPTSASQVADFLRNRRQKRELKAMFRKDSREAYLKEAGLRSLTAIRSGTPFVERLVVGNCEFCPLHCKLAW